MSKGAPTAMTLIGYSLLWTVLFFIVWVFSIALFLAGRWLIASVVIMLAVVGFFRHGASITRRAREALRRSGRQSQ
ncbi:small-conductance mechanosensitive channel [Bradyrhizobium elkanii]|jgi:small-conductance mechanosensitive channel|nr:small-conductance mechanosensitive channel [Bradyrhizobium elkanii]MCS3559761.1 small-conductance mechanosensitive channel [Bradyrhizobium elkanii]MCW2150393.1 small-conductance mechanosensitive channel [Bradyrhizobium elkanii]MCW2359549.1 small-conductance mechanosensitive channel [Bradyrhizobium elkanii]MCW2374124.1 small-conductance mechanosensitive channel [Bradyrhizobium elkanii]